jgi:DNA-binding response OmpR family regulator
MLCNMSMPSRGVVQKVVVADDDDLLSEVLVSALNSHGYAAVRAPGGVLSSNLTDGASLVILDAHIPGVEFGSTLQSLRDSRVGVLVLSGEPLPPSEVPADEYLSKPVDLVVLLSAVNRLASPMPVD